MTSLLQNNVAMDPQSRPFCLSLDPDTDRPRVSCSGLTLPYCPVSGVSDLLPLLNPLEPLHRRCRRSPPLSGGRLPFYGLQSRGDPLCTVENERLQLLKSPLPTKFSRHFQAQARAEVLVDRYESYGRDCHYSGSCVKVINDLIIFTGNDGKMRVSKFMDSESSIFDEVPGPGVRIGDSLLSSSRIYSLHPRLVDGSVMSLARHRLGVSVYSVQGWRTGSVSRVTRLPVSAGLASICWTSTGSVATVSSQADLSVWDLEVGGRTGVFPLPGGVLRYGWAGSEGGHHPASVLVSDRVQVHSLDTRSRDWTRLGLTGEGGDATLDMVRHLDREPRTPYCYLLTDRQYLLCDLRQTRAPVLATTTGLGRDGMAAASLWGRRRLGTSDWAVMGDSWGQLRLSVLDWGHQHCHTAGSVNISCQTTAQSPRLLGNIRGLGGWRDTVLRGRALAGEWLDVAVEERVGLPFTGIDLAPDKSGNIVIFAVNAAGDVFGKKIYLEEGYGEVESYETNQEIDLWLNNWADAVISKSFLPQVTLNQSSLHKTEKLKDCGHRVPVFVQSKSWKKRLRGKKRVTGKTKLDTEATEEETVKGVARSNTVFLPNVTDADWPKELTEIDPKTRLKFVNIDAIKKAMAEQSKNSKELSALANFTLDKPKNSYSYNHSANNKESPLSLVLRKKLLEEDTKDEIHQHILPHFQKLNLETFYNDAENENTQRILKIMLGELEDIDKPSSRRTSVSSVAPSPALPTEEDSTFPLASFWEDLGVDIPPSSQLGVEENDDNADEEEEEYEL